MESISLDSLQIIFTHLDIREISRLCYINYLFNKIGRSESLWKDILKRNYSIIEKDNDVTWRSKAKEVYIDSNLFWNLVDHNIDLYMKFSVPKLSLINKFEKNLADRAIREGKEFFATELIFKVFFSEDYSNYNIGNGRFLMNFIRLFEKVAELSPQKKISIKWLLGLYTKDQGFYHQKILRRIRVLVNIHLKYNNLFIVDVNPIQWTVELSKQSNY